MNTLILSPGNNVCTVSGQGEPVMLLHGSACSKGQWAGLTHLLEAQFQVAAVDLLGHGETPAWPGPAPLTLADEAMAIRTLVEHVRGPVHLVGHSFGGAVALHFAQAHPDQVRSLVLIEPVAFNLLGMAGPASAAPLGAGHMLPITHAEDVNQAIQTHLQARGLRRMVAA